MVRQLIKINNKHVEATIKAESDVAMRIAANIADICQKLDLQKEINILEKSMKDSYVNRNK